MSLYSPKRLVLYADDDHDDLDFVRESFHRHTNDIEVMTFSSAKELLAFISTNEGRNLHPCLIILDINMPGVDGKQALKTLRSIEEYKAIPTVLFSTSNSPHDASFATLHRAGFVSKPLNGRQMDVIVKKFLSHCNEDQPSSFGKSS